MAATRTPRRSPRRRSPRLMTGAPRTLLWCVASMVGAVTLALWLTHTDGGRTVADTARSTLATMARYVDGATTPARR